MNFNNWKDSKTRGSAAEEFVAKELFPSVGILVTKNNSINKKNIDILVGQKPTDVKIAFTPYPSNKTPAGLTKEEHLTLDHKNIKEYASGTQLLFLVRYAEPMVLSITVDEVWKIIENNPKRIYLRSYRSKKDKEKKIGISIKECLNITSLFPKKVIDRIKDLP